jgi:hypothetical protein
MLTDVAPVTFHDSVDVPPGLIVDGLLPNCIRVCGVPDGRVAADGEVRNVTQPGIRINSSDNTKERITNLFNFPPPKI